jgi:hypothetical protein
MEGKPYCLTGRIESVRRVAENKYMNNRINNKEKFFGLHLNEMRLIIREKSFW